MTSNPFVAIPYTKQHQDQYASKFDCGSDAINMFLLSSNSLDYGYGKTYVIIYNNEILGYYNIGTSCIQSENGLRMGGSAYINYLALDKKYQKIQYGNGYISDLLLGDCLNKVEDIRQNHIGLSFITLSSTEEGKRLYERNDFEELDEGMTIAQNDGELKCIPMYLHLDLED